MKMKKVLALGLAVAMTATMFVGCGSKKDDGNSSTTTNNGSTGEKQSVELKVWCSANDQDFTKKMGDKFNQENDKYDVKFTFNTVGEDDAKQQIEKDPKSIADVFLLPSDQLRDLAAGGYLRDLSALKDLGLETEGVFEAQALESCKYNDKLYAVPYTYNMLILFYNKSLLNETEVTKLETIMAKDLGAGVKNFAIDVGNGFYNNMFFAANGCQLYGADGKDPKTVTWNTAQGISVVKYLNNLVKSTKFHKPANNDYQTMLTNGKLAAYVGGSWEIADMKNKYLKDNYAATILPTINIDGADKPLKPFAAFKLVGVNQATQNAEAAARFAYFMASKEVQELRFKERGYAPTVTELVNQTYDDPAITALFNQAKDTNSVLTPQAVNFGDFWNPAGAIGDKIYKKEKDILTDAGIKKALDSAVASMTANADKK